MPIVPVTPDTVPRAAELRRLAHRLHALGALTLHRFAGDETWVGPAAHACQSDLATHARLLNVEADRLLAVARRLELDGGAAP